MWSGEYRPVRAHATFLSSPGNESEEGVFMGLNNVSVVTKWR
jgi:hypothetical protein